jgi:hypothetical protein
MAVHQAGLLLRIGWCSDQAYTIASCVPVTASCPRLAGAVLAGERSVWEIRRPRLKADR